MVTTNKQDDDGFVEALNAAFDLRKQMYHAFMEAMPEFIAQDTARIEYIVYRVAASISSVVATQFVLAALDEAMKIKEEDNDNPTEMRSMEAH